ncbi:MAG: site-specific DNA-methyltransferase [Pyrinomonadaceae bacterium]
MPVLNWIGKEAVVKHHKEVPFRLIEPVAELGARTLLSASPVPPARNGPAALSSDEASNDADMSVRAPNLIIEGDNLHALKALLPRYAGQVKCIYIDPPYNTGNEGWAYNDNVKSPEILKWLGEVVGKEGETLDRHDRWLCMMYPRLLLLKQFLREDGAIFVSIDDNEVAALRLVMDEIFGRGNFLAEIIWQKSFSPRNNAPTFSVSHEYIVSCSRNLERTTIHRLPTSELQKSRYRNPDNDPRGIWTSSDLTVSLTSGQRGQQFQKTGKGANLYEISSPSGIEFRPATARCWVYSEEKMKQLQADNRLWFGAKGNAMPRLKRFLSEIEGGLIPQTIWEFDAVGHTQEATQNVKEVFEDRTGVTFPTPKPTRLIQRILQIATDKDSLILDSFAGSGTTGHAVLKQNAEDGGNRRFILVEMDPKIAKDVTAERVRRVAEGYTKANGEKVAGLGGGFQYCRLSAEPLFDAAGAIRKDVTFAQLAEFVWFMETGSGRSEREAIATRFRDGLVEKNPVATAPGSDSPLLGLYKDRAVFLLFNGILKDRSDIGGNVLNGRTLEYINALLPKGFEGERVIYAARSRFDKSKLAKMNFTFHQLPYDLAAKTWF